MNGASQRELATKYGVSRDAIARHCRLEHWTEERKSAQAVVTQNVIRKTAEKAADNATLAADIKRKLLVRLNGMVDAFPDNAATEVRDLNKQYQRIYKLRDLAAAYKDLTADMVTAGNADIEDLTPLMELLR